MGTLAIKEYDTLLFNKVGAPEKSTKAKATQLNSGRGGNVQLCFHQTFIKLL